MCARCTVSVGTMHTVLMTKLTLFLEHPIHDDSSSTVILYILKTILDFDSQILSQLKIESFHKKVTIVCIIYRTKI